MHKKSPHPKPTSIKKKHPANRLQKKQIINRRAVHNNNNNKPQSPVLKNSLLKDPLPGKSVFSKISENLYKSTQKENFHNKTVKDLEKEKEETYNKLTEDSYLLSCANRENKQNQTIVKNFLTRKQLEFTSKKIGIDLEKDKDSAMDFVHLKDTKRRTSFTDRNLSFRSTRTFKEFLNDQKSLLEKQKQKLQANISIHSEKEKSYFRDRPYLNEISIKLANNRNTGIDIHSRLFNEFSEKKLLKEKSLLQNQKKTEKTLPKTKIQENTQRLYKEYELKNQNYIENEKKREKEFQNLALNSSMSSKSNEIIYKRFKKKLENAFMSIIGKNISENFEINYNEFIQILYLIGYTYKNYYEYREKEFSINNNKDLSHEFNKDNISVISKKKDQDTSRCKSKKLNYKDFSKTEKSILRDIDSGKSNFEYEREFKLSQDAWKIITKNKIFNEEITALPRRTLIFFLSVIGIYKGDVNDKFFKKEFSFLANTQNYSDSNLSNQIYRYFSIYRNNCIDNLLYRDKENQKILDIQSETDKSLPFKPLLEKSSIDFIENNFSMNSMHLSVDKHYDTYQKSHELKLKEYEKLKENLIKKECTFTTLTNTNKKIKADEVTKRLYSSGIRHLRNKSDNNENNLVENINDTKKNKNKIKKMFTTNPLANDCSVNKKIKNLEETRKQKVIERLIKEKGFKTKNDIIIINNNQINTNIIQTDRNILVNTPVKNFICTDEPLNNFKNTFSKFENKKNQYIFEITVANKPQNLVIYQDEDVNNAIKRFCNKFKLNSDDKKQIMKIINKKLNSFKTKQK